jgi:hypothetical protein
MNTIHHFLAGDLRCERCLIRTKKIHTAVSWRADAPTEVERRARTLPNFHGFMLPGVYCAECALKVGRAFDSLPRGEVGS